MTTDDLNRYRISTNFTFLKVIIVVLFLFLVFNLVSDIRKDAVSPKSVFGRSFILLALAGIFNFLRTRKRVDYDDVKQMIYLVDTKAQTEIEIPVEKVDKIYVSAFSAQGHSSYIIVYRDIHNQQHNLRLFPILFDDSINTIKAEARYKNPDVVIRGWTLGWNELFD